MGTAQPAPGTTFKKGSLVAGVTGINFGGVSVESIESTDLSDTVKTFTGGALDPGTIELELNVSEAQITALFPAANSAPTAMEIDYPGTLGKFTFSGFVSNWAASAALEGAVTGTATIQVSGAITYVPAA